MCKVLRILPGICIESPVSGGARGSRRPRKKTRHTTSASFRDEVTMTDKREGSGGRDIPLGRERGLPGAPTSLAVQLGHLALAVTFPACTRKQGWHTYVSQSCREGLRSNACNAHSRATSALTATATSLTADSGKTDIEFLLCRLSLWNIVVSWCPAYRLAHSRDVIHTHW